MRIFVSVRVNQDYKSTTVHRHNFVYSRKDHKFETQDSTRSI